VRIIIRDSPSQPADLRAESGHVRVTNEQRERTSLGDGWMSLTNDAATITIDS